MGLSPFWVNPKAIKVVFVASLLSIQAYSKSKSKIMLTQNRDDLSGWGHVSTRGQLFQCASTIKIQLLKRVGL